MRGLFIGFFAVITFISAFTYFVGCLTPYISPVGFWPMAFLALSFPYLAPVIFILAFLWVFIKKKVSLFLFLLFFAGFQNLFATFALNPSPKSSLTKASVSLRVLSWNVRGFDNPSIGADSANSIRRQMFDYIEKVNPDVLCLQEFGEHFIPGALSNTTELQKLGYTCFFKTNEMAWHYTYGTILAGTAIFSRLPIVDSGQTMLGDLTYPEHVAFIDVLLQQKPIRIFATHFKSINLFVNPEIRPNKIFFHGDTNFVFNATRFEKLKVFAQDHAREAMIAKKELNKSPYPVIIGADMNSVPTSYPYHVMSAGLQDAFKLNGQGLGTTMDNLPKTLRIDFLLVDEKLSIVNYRREELHLSDHFPQFIDVKWKE